MFKLWTDNYIETTKIQIKRQKGIGNNIDVLVIGIEDLHAILK